MEAVFRYFSESFWSFFDKRKYSPHTLKSMLLLSGEGHSTTRTCWRMFLNIFVQISALSCWVQTLYVQDMLKAEKYEVTSFVCENINILIIVLHYYYS